MSSLSAIFGQGEDVVPRSSGSNKTAAKINMGGSMIKSLADSIRSGTFGASNDSAAFNGTNKRHPRQNDTMPDDLGRMYEKAFLPGGFQSGGGGVPSNSRMVNVQASGGGEKTRSERIREACAAHGFSGVGLEDDTSQVVSVQASAGFSRRSTQAIGAPATTSFTADPSRLTVSSPSSADTTPFDLFFGGGRFGYKSNYDTGNQDVWSMPQAFTGESMRISQTIEQLVFLDGNWYTEVVAPIEVTNAMSIRWSRWEFSPHLTDVVPELGVNRLVQSRRIENSARFVRRAIGFMLEHGFMETEIGVTHYLMNVNQLVQAAIETNKFDVVHTLLTCHDHNKQFVLENGLLSGKQAEDVYRRELNNFDIFKKKKNGDFLLASNIAEEMQQYRGEADTWILHPDVAVYLTQMPAEKTDFLVAGAAGPQRLLDGPESYTSIRGQAVFLTRSFHVDEQGPVDIMSFPTQIGEHHWMTDYYREVSGESGVPYHSNLRDAQIYDEGRDKFVTVTLMDGLMHSNRFDETGAIIEWDEGDDMMMRYSDADKANDVLHYKARDGSVKPVQFYVNMKSAHMSAESRLLLGETVKQRMQGVPGWQRADELLNAARQAVAEMESYSWADARAYLEAVVAANQQVQSSAERAVGTSNPPLFDLQEYVVNAQSGSITLPVQISSNATAAIGLPPAFQSYEGIKEVVRVSKVQQGAALQDGGSLVNVDAATVTALEDFVKFFEQVVRKLRRIFPDSLLLNEKSASSWWQRPTAATVLFNNAVHKYRVPLWSKGTAVGVANQSGVPNALSDNALSTLLQVANPLVNRVNRVLQAVGAGSVGSPAAPLSENMQNFLQYIDLQSSAQQAASTENPQSPLVVQGGLTTNNYGSFAEALWGYHVVLYLIGSLPKREVQAAAASAADSQERADLLAKLTKIEDKIVNSYYPSFARLVKGVGKSASKLINDIKSLAAKPAKGKASFFEDSVNDSTLDATIGELFTKISEIPSVQGEKTLPHGSQGGGAVRTTLLASPLLIQGIAEAAQQAQTLDEITFMPSSLKLPDLPISATELLSLADVTGRVSSERPAALIEESLLGLAGGVGIEKTEFVEMANAFEAVSNMNDGDFEAVGGSLIGASAADSLFSSPAGARSVASAGSSYGDEEMDFIGDELEPIGDETLASYAAGKSSESVTDASAGLGGTGALRPSRRGLSQGLGAFVRARDALLAEESRRNFLELASAESDSWAYIFASVFNYTPVTLQSARRLIQSNVLFPFNFLLSRPHAEYQGAAAINVKRGGDTITTYQRPGKFEVGDDVNIGAHTGHYRYYSKVVCKEPKNVAVVRASYIGGYNGRMGSSFFKKSEYKPSRQEYGDGSLFSFMIGYEESESTAPKVINVSGSNGEIQMLYDLANENKSHYSSAPYYNWFWGFSVGRSLEIDRSSLKFANERTGANQNTLKGTTKRRNANTRDFTVIDSAQGHWGDEATLGSNVAAARRGDASFKPHPMTSVTFV